ncbi:MAG: insulinase family protein [Bacteroidales bacterium]|jgi:predicted Zn-dependent peptidase|nr:insulinase family protein [Bacteroidales bacterium]
MINYNSITLKSGLRVIINEDKSTPLVAVNMLYDVGAKNESENQTGLAHLFEHLMFSGSENYPDYDDLVENMSGESNAFTNNDITNYYLVVPSEYLLNALKLESDRMRHLTLFDKNLSVQKNVVIEEFKERYLNQPYGDLWQKIRALTYEHHPYKWQTIGKDISHIEQVTLPIARSFYDRFYTPQNAILAISGNIDDLNVAELDSIFPKFDNNVAKQDSITPEPLWAETKSMTITADVPVNVIVIAFQMCSRTDKDYYIYDLMSDVLSNGKSSRLYNSLVAQKGIFTEINAFISGDDDNGLFIIMGKYQDVSVEEGEKAIWNEIMIFANEEISDEELQKVKNKNESDIALSNLKVLDKAMNLAYYAHLGNTALINNEMEAYNAVTPSQIHALAKKTFLQSPHRTLYYLKK